MTRKNDNTVDGPQNQTIAGRALGVFTAGISNGEFGFPPETLMMLERGKGAKLWDSAGREYLDFSIGWGSCLVGHAREEVVEAVRKQAGSGSNFSYLNRHALELGEEIQRLSPGVERLRFCASGTEATMYCQRLARAFTGKPKILKFEGAYHGANEAGVTSLFPQLNLPYPTPELTSAGTPMARENLLVAPYNDLETTRQIIASNRDDLAAVLMEPLQRCTPPFPGFLEGVRQLCDEYAIPLIFDEVVTGFRLAYGGAQEKYGVVPDLVAYGKALGGGYPIGAFGGRADIMDHVNEHYIGQENYVWMASTLGGNPVSTAAANAALSVYRQPGIYEDLFERGSYLRQQMRLIIDDLEETAQVIGDGPLAQIVFTDQPVFNYRSTAQGDKRKGRAMMLALFRRGVFLNPMGTKLYLSIAHDRQLCDDFLDRFRSSLTEVRELPLKDAI
ncbi:aspartate aminotransferase family protein [Kiloniella laminariae]|uniref:aspartate aminotransferase family protein n=1 Tax=Kiloniella laminariae TaxID=454162 RepID=UPI00035F2DB1|nr:aspartate aminotransferase family protein [Kiloniella laminariae]